MPFAGSNTCPDTKIAKSIISCAEPITANMAIDIVSHGTLCSKIAAIITVGSLNTSNVDLMEKHNRAAETSASPSVKTFG